MEQAGKELKSTRHGKLPSQEQIAHELKLLKLSLDEKKQLAKRRKTLQKPCIENQKKTKTINISSLLLSIGESKACRTMY
jgi:hypothetical protein